ncbi:MAG: glycosyltransferase family 2 protein [Xanthomonadales bacterium]|nr:glycosyltransferase family 2 protein [Xanthomonadales bacterium]
MNANLKLLSESYSERFVLSVIVPMFNEHEVLPQCLERLDAVIKELNITTELIFVDDGSDDGSAEYLLAQASSSACIRIVRLSRNFGKESALTAGLDHANGAAVIILDADLQDPPELIPEMIKQWQSGVDVVLMQRRSRAGESWLKRNTAHLFYRLLQRTSNLKIPVDVGDFRLMSRRAVDALKLLPERNRFMKGLFAWVGMPTVVLKYDREPRAAGTTKWGYLSLMQLALEGIMSFSTSPLRWVMLLGVLAAFFGGSFGLLIIIKAIVFGDAVHGYPSLIAVITFLGGVQLLSIGIVGEYVGKTYIESKQRPNYLVRDVTKIPEVRKAEASGIAKTEAFYVKAS